MDMKLGMSSQHDLEISKKITKLSEQRPFEEIAQTFPAYIRRQLLTRFLAYYELFKLVNDVPGWIVECGIYRGFSFFALGRFLEIFSMGDKQRKLLGFDSFKGFGPLNVKDGPEDRSVTRNEGGTDPSDFKDEFFQLLKLANDDAFAPWSPRMEIVEGDVAVTIPKYCKENPGLRISMLHLDIDVYDPVSVALEQLYPKVVPGGLVVLDEFAHIDWPGESMAMKDVFEEKGWKLPKLQTLSWVGTPTTYFFKEEW